MKQMRPKEFSVRCPGGTSAVNPTSEFFAGFEKKSEIDTRGFSIVLIPHIAFILQYKSLYLSHFTKILESVTLSHFTLESLYQGLRLESLYARYCQLSPRLKNLTEE